MKSKTTRKLNRVDGLETDGAVSITPENLPKQIVDFDAIELDVEIDGWNGVRIKNDGTYVHGTTIEVKNSKGEWEPLSAVQSIKLEMSVDNPIPKITVEYYVLKGEGKNGKSRV